MDVCAGSGKNEKSDHSIDKTHIQALALARAYALALALARV